MKLFKKKVKTDPRKLWKHEFDGQPFFSSPSVSQVKEKAQAERTWLLRFALANYFGVSDQEVVDFAKRAYEATLGHAPEGDLTPWERSKEVEKYKFINRILPTISNEYHAAYQITGPSEKLLIVRYNVR